MPRLVLTTATIGVLMVFHANPGHAGELEEMRAMLLEMQQRLQQQQARIEQLERQQALPPAATTPATPQALTVAAIPGATQSAPSASLQASSGTIPGIDPKLASFYGRVDVFLDYGTGGSGGSRLSLESGGYTGSRVGVKGGRELAPGVQAIYQLEAGYFINNGRIGQSSGGNTRLFGRQAYVGIEGRLGRLTVGRQYSPYFLQLIGYDVLENGYGSPTNDGNVPPGPTRYDNALIYATPDLGGLKASALTALGGQTGATRHNAYGLSLDFNRGPLAIGAGYLYDDHTTALDRSARYLFSGASYKLGRVQLMGGLSEIAYRPDIGADSDWRSWFAGTRIEATGSGQLRLVYGEGYSPQAVINNRGRVFSATWIETINQQFKAYLALSRHINYQGSAIAASGTAAYGYYTINPGDNATGIAAGVQYFF